MFNELLFCTTLTNMQHTPPVNEVSPIPCIQQYTAPSMSSTYDNVINTTELSKKNGAGAYPWEIIKPYDNTKYFLYENYFRIGGKSRHNSKIYYYFYRLDRRRCDITRQLINPVDSKSVKYFNIDNVLTEMSYQIDKASRGSHAFLPKLIYYRQVVLDLQKETLDFQQSILNTFYFSQYVQNLNTLVLSAEAVVQFESMFGLR